MIRLYHGSNVDIERIDLSRSKRGKDFGQGFYLNANPDQAMAMAIRTTRFLNVGRPTLSCFEFDEEKATEIGLIIKEFPSITFTKLNDPECGLYYQGAVYIFQFLKSEIETGKIA